jgi:hypothetical protein
MADNPAKNLADVYSAPTTDTGIIVNGKYYKLVARVFMEVALLGGAKIYMGAKGAATGGATLIALPLAMEGSTGLRLSIGLLKQKCRINGVTINYSRVSSVVSAAKNSLSRVNNAVTAFAATGQALQTTVTKNALAAESTAITQSLTSSAANRLQTSLEECRTSASALRQTAESATEVCAEMNRVLTLYNGAIDSLQLSAAANNRLAQAATMTIANLEDTAGLHMEN